MRKVYRSVSVALLVAGLLAAARAEASPGPVRTPVRNEIESNGSPGTATPLPLSGGYGAGVGSLSAGDQDYWSFIAPAGARVWILTDTGGTATGDSRDTIVDVFASDGVTPVETDDDGGTGNGGDGTVEGATSSAIAGRVLVTGGVYYIRVRVFNPTRTINPYMLFVAVTRPFHESVESEPNDTPGTATKLIGSGPLRVRTATIGSAGDLDFYSVAAKAGDKLFISADADTNRDGTFTDLVIDLFSSDGSTQLLTLKRPFHGGTNDYAGTGAVYYIDTAGTYYVRVQHFNPTSTGTYHLFAAVSRFVDPVVDVDGDRRADVGVYRASTGQWLISRSINNGADVVPWGAPALDDIPVPGDYDGDGKADIAVYRNATGEWLIRYSSGGSAVIGWGAPSLEDIAVPADYNNDGQTDIAVYRGSTGEWFVRYGSGGISSVLWGVPSLDDKPVPADYNGDGAADIAVYRNATGEWFFQYSGGGFGSTQFGAPSLGDIPVPGDYDGDGAADGAVYRNSTGQWFVNYAAGGVGSVAWGAPSLGDIPVPADYDGDGATDVAIYRSSTGQWFIAGSAGSTIIRIWGSSSFNDVPLSRPAALR
jgi:FG-GAP-like repeat